MRETESKPQAASSTGSSQSVLRVVFSVDEALDPAPIVRVSTAGTPVGRKASHGLLLDDARVSSHHLTVHGNDGGALTLADAGSKNGTFVNGVRVQHASLSRGDVISVGDTCIVVAEAPEGAGDVPIDGLVGDSAAMRRVRATVESLGPAGLTVLLVAESGSGKEMVARALHGASGAPGAFIAVNCAAVPENLFESQFFGHKAGAFTGAVAHSGFFREANEGTLFLDEIGDLPIALQPKLLRAIQERAVTPLGAARPVSVQARIMAATNRDLAQAVARGAFRGDLLARLFEAHVTLPPLRERREDILSLFLLGLGRKVAMTHALAHALLLHQWPFNVRELFATARQLSLGSTPGKPLDVQAFEERLAAMATPGARREEVVAPVAVRSEPRSLDREELTRHLTDYRGNVAEVARATGRSRRQVYRWIAKFGIEVDKFRG